MKMLKKILVEKTRGQLTVDSTESTEGGYIENKKKQKYLSIKSMEKTFFIKSFIYCDHFQKGTTTRINCVRNK